MGKTNLEIPEWIFSKWKFKWREYEIQWRNAKKSEMKNETIGKPQNGPKIQNCL